MHYEAYYGRALGEAVPADELPVDSLGEVVAHEEPKYVGRAVLRVSEDVLADLHGGGCWAPEGMRNATFLVRPLSRGETVTLISRVK